MVEPTSPPPTSASEKTRRTEAVSSSSCPPQKYVHPPKHATDYNGISWPEMCFEGPQDEHVFLLGDWGGSSPGIPVVNRNPARNFLPGIDDRAQFLVAQQMNIRADDKDPRYILNVGDNFYWDGCPEKCGSRSVDEAIKSFYRSSTAENDNKCAPQFYSVFETMYMGPGMDGKPWLSVLGNHDFGGDHYWAGWDMMIAYTWGPGGRWLLPALYWHQHVKYPSKDFAVDYYMLDTSVGDVTDIYKDIGHNLCNGVKQVHYGGNTPPQYEKSCLPHVPDAPTSPETCLKWFRDLWDDQVVWLRDMLNRSTAEWQVIVTHFPPEKITYLPKVVDDLKALGDEYGVDFLVAGHRHAQELHPTGHVPYADTPGIPYAISGGGGGITSEEPPYQFGHGPSQYGFMDITLTKETLTVEDVNHRGAVVKSMVLHPRPRKR